MIKARAEDPAMVGIVGGDSGLMVVTTRTTWTNNQNVTTVTVEFDSALSREFRDLIRQIDEMHGTDIPPEIEKSDLDLSKLTIEELRTLDGILDKAKPGGVGVSGGDGLPANVGGIGTGKLHQGQIGKQDLLGFIQKTKPDYIVDPFHEELCGILQKFHAACRAKTRPRVIIVAPPQHWQKRSCKQAVSGMGVRPRPQNADHRWQLRQFLGRSAFAGCTADDDLGRVFRNLPLYVH